jgi:mono/diheme cytochrome c family protein
VGRVRHPLMLAVALAVMPASANAQDGNMAAGYVFPREACKACHMVELDQLSPRRLVIAPAFREIANAPGITATALRVLLRSSHPKMPNLILTPEETADVIAYILSLQDRG